MDFIERIAPLAIKYMNQEGILASLTLAQAIIESDFGRSELAVEANNLFGMKANSTWKGAIYKKRTTEIVNGRTIDIESNFCKFISQEECIKYRSTVFLKMDRYKPLWGVTDYKVAAQTIYECGYATDPKYPKKLIDVIEKYKLYEYDQKTNHTPEKEESNAMPKDDMKGHWAEKELKKAKDKGILKGHQDGSMRPDEPVTRAQIAVILDRLGLLD